MSAVPLDTKHPRRLSSFLYRKRSRRNERESDSEFFALPLAPEQTLSHASHPHAPVKVVMKRRNCIVSFGEVKIHTHPLTLGDSPAVTNGSVPLTLDWKPSKDSETFDIDSHEKTRQGREPEKITRTECRQILKDQKVKKSQGFEVLEQVMAIQNSRNLAIEEVTIM